MPTYQYKILILLLEFTIDNLTGRKQPQRAKKKNNKKNNQKQYTFAPCALKSIFGENFSKEIETVPKFKTPLIRTGA